MKLLVFGSLNIDHVYNLPHIVAPGETITSKAYNLNCGGKGLNQAIAMSKAGLDVWMGGMVGSDGTELIKELEKNGVNISLVRESRERTGNAIIQVDDSGQNCIVLFSGANRCVDHALADDILSHFSEGDIMVLQNEISSLDYIIDKAYDRGITIALNPSPFDDHLKACDMSKISYFFVNEIEGEQLTGFKDPDDILADMKKRFPKAHVVLTLGSDGSRYSGPDGDFSQSIFPVTAVDTTAAGDTFSGYFLAGVNNKLPKQDCLRQAAAASAIAVTRKGAGASIPTPAEVSAFLKIE